MAHGVGQDLRRDAIEDVGDGLPGLGQGRILQQAPQLRGHGPVPGAAGQVVQCEVDRAVAEPAEPISVDRTPPKREFGGAARFAPPRTNALQTSP